MQPPALDSHAPHVWIARLALTRPYLATLYEILSVDERERASRFKVVAPREQFIVGRACLRQVLARYTGRDPRALRLAYGAHGKPELVEAEGLAFSVSHSADIVIVAVARGQLIGIDVERIRDGFDHQGISDRYFTSAERQHLRDLPPDVRLATFFRYWSRKEAVLKAIGVGLAMDLNSLEVDAPSPNRVGRVERRCDSVTKPWFVYELPIDPDYVATLAAPSPTLAPLVVGLPFAGGASG